MELHLDLCCAIHCHKQGHYFGAYRKMSITRRQGCNGFFLCWSQEKNKNGKWGERIRILCNFEAKIGLKWEHTYTCMCIYIYGRAEGWNIGTIMLIFNMNKLKPLSHHVTFYAFTSIHYHTNYRLYTTTINFSLDIGPLKIKKLRKKIMLCNLAFLLFQYNF